MQNTEWIDMLRVIPPEQQNELVLVLKNMSEISVDMFFRFEQNFLVLRGRVAGTVDEGRGFFVPYDQMVYFRLEKVVNLSELQSIFEGLPGRTTAPVAESPQPEDVAPVPPAPVPAPALPAPAAADGPAPADATATRNALLDRIRAARTQVASNRHRTQ
jgi:hypothetical protein